jgi:hypothetical protein
VLSGGVQVEKRLFQVQEGQRVRLKQARDLAVKRLYLREGL